MERKTTYKFNIIIHPVTGWKSKERINEELTNWIIALLYKSGKLNESIVHCDTD